MTATRKPLDLAQFEGHTPGPWEVRRGKANEYQGAPTITEVRAGRSVIAPLGNEYTDTQRADARLIAAAPALASECKRQREQIAALREALEAILPVEERKLASLEKRTYSIGLTTVRRRVEQARAALKVSP